MEDTRQDDDLINEGDNALSTDASSKPIQNVDDLFCRLGNPGRLQIIWFILLCLNLFTIAPSHVVGVFFGYSPVHYCNANYNVPMTNSRNATSKWNPQTNSSSVQTNGARLQTTDSTPIVEVVERSDCFVTFNVAGETNVTQACRKGEWRYELGSRETTTVTEFDLVCDHRFLANLSSTLYFLGLMLAGFVCGYASDIFGRKPVLILTLFLVLATGVGIAFSHHFLLFLALRLANGFGIQGIQQSALVLAVELFPIHKRGYAGGIFVISWGLGYIFLCVMAWVTQNWRHLQLVLLVPTIISCICVWFIGESVRWLLSRGKTRQAGQVISKITKFNNLKESFEKELRMLSQQKNHQVKQHRSYLTLFRTPQMRRRTIYMAYIWFATNFCFYGMTFNSSNLSLVGNRYLNFTISAVIETISICIGSWAVIRFGRRKPVMTVFTCGAICCFISAAIPRHEGDGSFFALFLVAVYVLTKFAFIELYCFTDLFAVEVFPTVVRNMGIGVCVFMGRCGSLLAPQVTLLKELAFEELPVLLIAVVALTGAALAYLLPETSRERLPDTVEDVETAAGVTASPKSVIFVKEKVHNSRNDNVDTVKLQNVDKEL